MKLVNAELLLNLDIEENEPSVLIIENPSIMTDVVGQLLELCNSGEGDFILSEDGKQLSFEKTTEVIINPFLIDFNSRKVQSKLYSELLEEEMSYVEEKVLIQTLIVEYLDKRIQNVPYEMISYELDLDSLKLFRMFEVRIEPQCNSLIEKMAEYTKILSRLLRKRLLVFVSISNYLDTNELNALYEICNYNKMKVLFIECHELCLPFYTKTYIIDKDKCMIMNNTSHI